MMEQHWKGLLAIDRYVARSSGILQELDRKILTLLYQPLIGSFAYSLYMTLWSELEQDRLWGEETSHHSLMAIMQMNLHDIYKERLKLEGIGLLKTYVDDQKEVRTYIYELQTPLKPDDFFQDGILNIYLYNRVGNSKYQQLRRFFSDIQIEKNMKEVTRSFTEIFESVHPSEMVSRASGETVENLILNSNYEYMTSNKLSTLELKEEVFDFELLFSGLSEAIIPQKSITKAVKETIVKLSHLYGIDAIEMKNILMNAIESDDSINIEQLRKAARDWYQFQYGDHLPTLCDKIQPLKLRTIQEKKERSQEEELIYQLEKISPRQFLKDISDGTEPSAADLKIIEEVMFQQKLEPGVVNVLIYYVMLQTNMKLTRSYVQKIASHWARLKLKTVQEAMELAKKLASEQETKVNNSKKKRVVRKEILPDWLAEDNAAGEKEEAKLNNEQFEEEKKKLLERIKNYKNKAQEGQ